MINYIIVKINMYVNKLVNFVQNNVHKVHLLNINIFVILDIVINNVLWIVIENVVNNIHMN